MQIISLDNKLIKHACALKNKKHREESGEFLAEGFRVVTGLLKHDFSTFKSIFVTERQRDKFCVAALNAGATERFLDERVYIVPGTLMKKLCDTDSPQEIVAVFAQKKEFDLDGVAAEEESGGRYLYLDRIRDPGNLGAILRTAAAAGYRVILDNCADVYSPKVVRAGMGAALLCDFAHGGAEVFDKLRQNGFQIYAADMGGENMYQFNPPQKLCLVIGGEAEGISPDIMQQCDKVVSIPMQKVESLNAAVAAAILMYSFMLHTLS